MERAYKYKKKHLIIQEDDTNKSRRTVKQNMTENYKGDVRNCGSDFFQIQRRQPGRLFYFDFCTWFYFTYLIR